MPTELEPAILKRVNQWLDGNYDPGTKQKIRALMDAGATADVTDAFYRDLEFGTGGLRGIMGPGSNRINKYTIGAATQGLSNFLKKTYPGEEIKVAVAHDSRNNSDFFAGVVADVFSANGIYVFFFNALRPTPELSFAIRYLQCKSGVMLTASHNPKEYNGYKAYGHDGGQFVAPYDKQVMEEVAKITSIDEIKFTRDDHKVEQIGENIDAVFLERMTRLSLSPDAIRRQKDLKIVYSPIHGTGITLVPQVLKRFGFENVVLVEEQATPDGNFPTVIYPNPEEKETLTLALDKAKETDADLVLATDPDADRVGIAVKNDKGEFILLNGNQTGSLLIHYLLTAWEKNGRLTGNEYIVKTIVTTYLIDALAAKKKVECYNTLTGFKYIGEVMTRLEGKKMFIGGGEESYGYLVGDLVRDKDAIVSSAFIAEMTAYYKDMGSSLFEAMIEMYREYGHYKEKLISITKKGKTGAEEILAMMDKFRATPPSSLAGAKVIKLKDYEQLTETDLINGTSVPLDFPKSDVLQFITEDGSIISARPSGTEPKIKFYCSVNQPLGDISKFHESEKELEDKIDRIMSDLSI